MPEDHSCEFDFKEFGKNELERKNPVVVARKLETI